MKTFLILGAGTGGTMMANKLSKRLDLKEWKIILVDRDEAHYYQPGFLFLPFGYYKPEEVYQAKKKFVPSGVQLIMSNIELIEPEASKVTLSKDNQVIHYDQLLIATGTDIHPEEVDGMLDGWRKNIFDYYTFDGAMALREYLKNFNGGRIVLNSRIVVPGVHAVVGRSPSYGSCSVVARMRSTPSSPLTTQRRMYL